MLGTWGFDGIPLNAYHSHSQDNQRFIALRAQCGRVARVPSN